MKTRTIIDCDPGMDDAIAILTAFGSGLFDVDAITSVPGNVPADVGARNAQRVVALAGRPGFTVAQGAASPLKSKDLPVDPFSHGSDGLAETHLPAPTAALDPRDAATVIVEAAAKDGPPLTILALGPMTNLALALEMDPGLPEKVGAVVAIAGTFGLNEWGLRKATGDNPVSEWNVFVDPEAARRVLHAGFDLTMLGLDVTTHPDNVVSERILGRLAAGDGPAAKFMHDAVAFVTGRGFGSWCTLIDPLAVAFAAHPDLFKTQRFSLDIETEGRVARGQTVIERRDHFAWPELAPADLVVDVDYDAAIEFICDSVLAADETRSAAPATR
jgi:inosine-uridine nucleoside N-ribohydrolase